MITSRNLDVQMRNLVAKRMGDLNGRGRRFLQANEAMARTVCNAPSVGKIGDIGVGEVVEVGRDVKNFKTGDVIVTDFISSLYVTKAHEATADL